MVLRIVIADDERPARAFLTALLRDFDDIEIVGEAKNGAEAIEVIEDKRPDLALLDLQMPELDGLEVVRMLNKKHMPIEHNWQALIGKYIASNYPPEVVAVYDQMGQTPYYSGPRAIFIDSFGLTLLWRNAI